MYRLFCLACCLFSCFALSAQDFAVKKQLHAQRTAHPVRIDGVLSEAAWAGAPIAGDFIQKDPHPGIPASQRTEVRVLYDDYAIYVGATLYDSAPDSILRELTQRDNLGNTDWFGVLIDAYRDGINGVGFVVTPTGIQTDVKYSSLKAGGAEDASWDAVWHSEVRITGEGWTVEMEIPYASLRFPKRREQQWHLNFGRQIRRHREISYWNEVKPEIGGFVSQAGILLGITDIKSPVRLSATPYLVAYAENNYARNNNPKSTWGRSFNGGMDVKYGISDAFTLDMTLIPDFGQVQSDNNVLNLSPFEVRFAENRPFFTEGTELFNKGNLFYSRRIGGEPLNFSKVASWLRPGERIVSNPTSTQLYNATKVSGRFKSGLGLGVFNATAARSTAVLRSDDGTEREVETGPLTNYNVMVLDQNLKNNSFVSLINTNVLRDGHDYDANVTSGQFVLRNRTNAYAASGNATLSQRFFRDSADIGHQYSFQLARTSGRIQYSATYVVESDNYNPRDLGFLLSPNERTVTANISYNRFQPTRLFNRYNVTLGTYYSRLFRPDAFAAFNMTLNAFFFTRRFFAFGARAELDPVRNDDFFEPRTSDFSRYYALPRNFNVGGFISTDYRKRFAIDVDANYRWFDEAGRSRVTLSVQPRFRISDKWSLFAGYTQVNAFNDVGFVKKNSVSRGYAGLPADAIVFGHRDQVVYENVLSTRYIFTNRMGLTFRLRHYWTKVRYLEFHELGKSGDLLDTDYRGTNDNDMPLHNTSFNIFNIDMVYTWRFAPGSDLIMVWKNAITGAGSDTGETYLSNLQRLAEQPQTNSFSLKVVYFMDYLTLTRRHSS